MNFITILLFNLMSFAVSKTFSNEFTICDSTNKISLDSLSLIPETPVASQDLQIVLKGKTDIELNEKTSLQLNVNAFGINIVSEKYSLCDYIDECIIKPGNFELHLTQSIPNTVPQDIELKNKLSIINPDSVDGCFEVDTKINQQLKEVHMKLLFDSWKNQHQKEYDSLLEHNKRFNIFKDNIERINEYNKLQKLQNDDLKLAMNHFGDMTNEEYINTLTPITQVPTKKNNLFRTLIKSIPESKDWVDEGKVSEVKNQGQCGSCWSFSVTGALESAYAIKYNEIIELSEQQLVDCSTSYGNNGCNGGLMDYGFQYVIDNGLTTEKNYPYVAKDGKCHTKDLLQSKIKVRSYADVKVNDELELKQAVSNQPVSVAIEADQMAFQFYSSGVLKKSKCGTNLDHGVLLVGYGELNGTKYWKVKNSWGSKWGSDGYILLERTDETNSKGTCGIAMSASYPILS